MRVMLLTAVLMLVAVAPTAVAGPDHPGCYDRGPVVDGVVVEVWLNRNCEPDVRTNPPEGCRIGDIVYC